MKIAALKFLYAIASSKRLAVGLMVYAAFLVFVARLAQREIGVAAAQAEYFESFFCVGSLGPLKFPLFGGALVGLAAIVNILASGWRYVSGGLFGFGASVAHMALVLLIVSGALQYFMRVEGSLVLREGMVLRHYRGRSKGGRGGRARQASVQREARGFFRRALGFELDPEELFEQGRIFPRRKQVGTGRVDELPGVLRRLDFLPDVVRRRRADERAFRRPQSRAASAVARGRGDIYRHGDNVPAEAL